MPLCHRFSGRLQRLLPALVRQQATPFYVYDEQGIVASHEQLQGAFRGRAFRQYFAVKALPNPAVLRSLIAHGSGLDCSSPVELEIAVRLGLSGEDIVFTPNNVDSHEYDKAIALGARVTLDDRSALQGLDRLPPVVAFRVAAGAFQDNPLMGDRRRSKFGVPRDQLPHAYAEAIERGATRFGIHSMTLANELSAERMAAAGAELIATAAAVAQQLSLSFEYINLGGGPGIPYRPGEQAFDFQLYASKICTALDQHFGTAAPPMLLMECGRCISGPHGVLVTRVVSRSSKGSEVVGVDACMSALMRPALYESAYHHISSTAPEGRPHVMVDVVGALCENNDKFGLDRILPDPHLGDVLLIQDCGAHGHAMGFNYNGRLRPAEFLLARDGDVLQIRRAENIADYLSTVSLSPVPACSSERVCGTTA